MALVKIVPNNEKVIPQGTEPVEIAFDVINPADTSLKISVDTTGELKDKGWAKVQGPVVVVLPAHAQEKLKVTVTVAAGAEVKDYTFKLRVYDPQQPEVAEESAAVTVSVQKKGVIEPPPPPPPPKWWLIIGGIVGGLAVIGGIAFLLIHLLGGAKVPDVVGKSLTEATQILNGQKLTVIDPASEQPSAEVEPGFVISQTPAAGEKAPESKAVALVISAITEEVPSVISLNVPAAEKKLVEAGFALGEVTSKTTGESPGGAVTAQEPAPGQRAMPGSVVALTVEKQLITVPPLKNLLMPQALAQLSSVGLTQGTTTAANTGAPATTIVGQKPDAGAQAEPGSAVDLLVEGSKVPVPSVIGMPLANATARITGASLKVAAVGNDRRPPANAVLGTVKTQSPVANAQVPPGTDVSLVVYAPRLIIDHRFRPVQIKTLGNLKVTAAGLRVVPPEEKQ
jgi:beta-lactam-binding protein with PASTA domain